MSDGYWSSRVKDLWFYAALTISLLSVAWLFLPYLYVLLFSIVTVVVCWPVYSWFVRVSRGRKLLASVLTTLLLGVVVFGPLAYILFLFAVEVEAVTSYAIDMMQSGEVMKWVESNRATVLESEYMPVLVREQIEPLLRGQDGELPLDSELVEWVQKGTLAGLRYAGGELPGLLSTAVDLSIDTIIFVFSVVTLFVQGPRLLTVVKNLSPMEDAYEERLFSVFGEFSRNMVVGSLATAVIQGVIAGMGYGIAGLDKVTFFAIMTAVGSFVPVVGTVVVWIPIVIYLVAIGHYGMAIFLAIWCLVLVGGIDNVLKPIFMRGSSDIHPLLVFLAVFGGLYWMGVSGILVGPVLVAFFLALYAIYERDFLGIEPPEEVKKTGKGPWARMLRWAEDLLRSRAAVSEPENVPAEDDGQLDGADAGVADLGVADAGVADPST